MTIRFIRSCARLVLLTAAGLLLQACGGGYAEVPVASAPVVGLGLQLVQVDFNTVQLDWSHDAAAATYAVTRDGGPLAQVRGETLLDASVFRGYRYCYQVSGYDPYGALVSLSSVGCITVL